MSMLRPEIASATQPSHGAVTIAADAKSLAYKPADGYCNAATTSPDTFTYRLNGGSQATVAVTVVCAPEQVPAPAAATTEPSQTPSRPPCMSRRRIVVNLGLPSRSRIRSGTATLNGKRLVRLSTRSRRIVVDLRTKPLGTYVVRVRARTQAGNAVAFTRRYRTCAPRKKP